MRAEEDRRAALGAARGSAEVPDRRADLRARLVLVDAEAERAQLSGDTVCDVALLPRRARQRAQLGEEVEDGAHYPADPRSRGSACSGST